MYWYCGPPRILYRVEIRNIDERRRLFNRILIGVVASLVIGGISIALLVLGITLPIVLTRGTTTTTTTTTTTGPTTTTVTITYQVDTSYIATGDPPTNTINSVASIGDCETLCTNDNACFFVTYDSNTCNLFGSNSGLQLSGTPIQTAIKVVNGVPKVIPFSPG